MKNKFFRIEKVKSHLNITLFGIKLNILLKNFQKERTNFQKIYQSYDNAEDIPPAEGNLRLVQRANLKLLTAFNDICKSYNLEYWIDFGTLLGAVRHKGFIPWDDDIDVGMMREDYEKFIKLFADNIPQYPDLKTVFSNNHKHKCFAKLIHKKSENICLDIFPYDKYYSPLNNTEKQDLSGKIAKITKLKGVEYLRYFKTDTKIRKFFKKVTQEKILQNKPVECEHPAVFMAIDFPHKWKNKVYDWETLFPLKNILFEGIEVSAPNKPDAVLRSIYGDYMKIPKDSYPRHSGFMDMDEKECRQLEDIAG